MSKSYAKDLLLQIRYPYTAGIIAVVWLGSAVLVAIDRSLPLEELVVTNAVATAILALLGFSTGRR
jgi:hypothetical protein